MLFKLSSTSRKQRTVRMRFLAVCFAIASWVHPERAQATDDAAHRLDQLAEVLGSAGFTGKIESTLEARLGRRIDPALADVGRLLFFDKILGLHNDNSCAGCHSPAFGFGDSQPIAIGVDNNDIVGPSRRGPRNQRRSPSVANSLFYRR